MIHFLKITVLGVLLAFSMLAPAHAQSLFSTTPAPAETALVLPDPLTPDAANALISRLSDTDVRKLLLDQLNTQAVTVEDSAGLSDFFYHATTGAASMVTLSMQSLPVFFHRQPQAFATFYEKIGSGGLLNLLGCSATI